MMIDSVVWAQYINVTDTRTDSHDAVANAAPTHCVGRQKVSASTKVLVFKPHRMHEIQTIAIDDPVAWASANPSVTHATILSPYYSSDGATMWSLRYYCYVTRFS